LLKQTNYQGPLVPCKPTTNINEIETGPAGTLGIRNSLHCLPGRHRPHPHRPCRPQPVESEAEDPHLLRRETTSKDGIAARRKQASWNKQYLSKVLSNWNVIALTDCPTAPHIFPAPRYNPADGSQSPAGVKPLMEDSIWRSASQWYGTGPCVAPRQGS